ncbi:hypothetical protein [Paraburkholderia terrae]|uniref:hypothetical protein n=1 Tax=Paraburkholderia terrae TaxID=311230 RepID=UPI003365373F
MSIILKFVSLRSPTDIVDPLALAARSDFQQKLEEAVAQPDPSSNLVAIAKSLVGEGHFVESAEELRGGAELLSLLKRLSESPTHVIAEIEPLVRAAVGDAVPPGDVTRSKDSVLAAYLLEPDGPDSSTAVKLVRAYHIAELVLAGNASAAQIDALLRAPLVLPDYLLMPRRLASKSNVNESGSEEQKQSADQAVDALLKEFSAAQKHYDVVENALAEIASHDEDELVLSELGLRQPLAELYLTRPADVAGGDIHPVATPSRRKSPFTGTISPTSPLRRAAARSNVFLSESAIRLLSEPVAGVLRKLGLPPATTSIRDLQNKLTIDYELSGQKLSDLSVELGTLQTVAKAKGAAVSAAIGKWKVEPVDDISEQEPVASAPPSAFTTIKPLGYAELCVVRSHLVRYERAEVASLESVMAGERLTHTLHRLVESEVADTTESERASVASLAQNVAEQGGGKTTAQAVGAGRGPLTSDGPEWFSKSVTDSVSSTLSERNLSASVSRQLRRTEDDTEHLLDNTAGATADFAVYQSLDRVYQAAVFSYGTRLLYDLIVPEPAALFREALSRGRGQDRLPPKPARFNLRADQLTAKNWSYYAAGHRASGVEPPPAAQITVTENFAGKAADPFSGELNSNTLEFAESRISRVPKGFKAISYRLIAMASGWTAYVLRITIGAKQIIVDSDWSGTVFSGTLDGETESLPVALIADGNGTQASISTLAVAVEILCEPTADAVAAWRTKTHGQILAGNQQRFAEYEEQIATRDATARLRLQSLDAVRQRNIVRDELKRTILAVLTNQNFGTFNAMRIDSLGFPYPDAAATVALSAYIRFFEQAVEWEHIEYAFLPYFWGSRASWVSKLLGAEPDTQFAAFLASGAARVVIPIRRNYETAFERFLNTGKTPDTTELLDVGGRFWASIVTQLREQDSGDDSETVVGTPWEYRIASDLVRARRDDKLPKWTLTNGNWVEAPDANS